MIRFEGYERRIAQIEACMKEYGIADLEDAKAICTSKGIDVDAIVRGIQNICFENAIWAYTLGAAIAIKKGAKDAASAAEAIGIGLQAFCIPGSVADQRQVCLLYTSEGEFWIRLLYTHPAHWSDELTAAIAESPKVARYVDTVSYTHLDVYKRQRPECPSWLQAFPPRLLPPC